MPHLFNSWPEVAKRLHDAASVLLFLDFDGTLAPVTARPENASIDESTRHSLRRLAMHPRVRVYVVSGRGQKDLRNRVRVPCVHYLGSHGLGEKALDRGAKTALEEARDELTRRLNGSGVLRVENKSASFALHYRGADRKTVQRADRSLRQVMEPHAERLRVLEGDQAWEILPREVAGKGAAARRYLHFSSRALPIYVGNDGTDEPAFKALASGVTVRVGPARASRAQFQLRNPAEVRQLLERIEREVR